MKILILATRYLGLGGAEAYTRMFAEAAAASGAQVEVLSFLGGDVPDRGSAVRYLGHAASRSTAPAQARFVADVLRRGRGYDLFVCSHVAVAPIGLILHRLFGTPYVVFAHGIEVWGSLGPRRRVALRRAARVVAVSRFTARALVREHGVAEDRVVVIYPAVDPAMLRRALEEPDAPPSHTGVTLLTVARLSAQERYKGCDAVIAALPDVIAAAGPVRYAIVGDGDDRPRLEVVARDRGVADAVRFAGRVPADGLAAWYRDCDVFVMPSVAELRPGGWAGEGFGIVYLEAAAFRRPVIAGAGGGAPEAVQDGTTGVVVDGRDVRAVAAAIAGLARDAALRARMGDAGRRWVLERFTFDRLREQVGATVRVASAARPR